MPIRTKIVAIAAGVVVFAAVSASAATLGGLQTDDLGANSNSVKGQVTAGVVITWTTAYDPTLGGYKVTGATLGALGGQSIPSASSVKITLKGAAGASLGEITSTDGGSTWSTIATTIPARSVIGASVVINGGSATAVVDATP